MKRDSPSSQAFESESDHILRIRKQLSELNQTTPNILHLRDGEVVLYRRPKNSFWHCRFKLQEQKWERRSTQKASLENAMIRACEMYDEARFRQRLGLAHSKRNFAEIAHATLNDLKKQIDSGAGKVVYLSYITCIEKYFLPYFKDMGFEEINNKHIADFELWRNRQMKKVPKASTLKNFSSAWSKLLQTAIMRGWLSHTVAVPKLSTQGMKSTPRPAFNKKEMDRMLAYMVEWETQGRFSVEHEIRPLLRDYIELLLYTGMRHGTEALNIKWKDVQWYSDDDIRYLRIWVSGKTGGRWLIAKHKAVDALKRLHQRQKSVRDLDFEDLLVSNKSNLIFTTSDGYQPRRLDGTFKRLMRDMNMMRGEEGQNRTLYSIRHTYATFELLEGNVDIHTLSKQMGNSAAMIEKHYSKLTATLAAKKLA